MRFSFWCNYNLSNRRTFILFVDDVDIEEDVNLQDLGDVGDNASNDTQDFEQRFDSYDNINLSLDPSSWI